MTEPPTEEENHQLGHLFRIVRREYPALDVEGATDILVTRGWLTGRVIEGKRYWDLTDEGRRIADDHIRRYSAGQCAAEAHRLGFA